MMKRLLLSMLFAISGAAHAADVVEVWKDPGCGCCAKWVEHLQAAGFETRTHRVDDMNAARVGGYAIEGHVPAAEIRRLLKERPMAAGLAVPGMPPGSPGMEAERTQPYDVLLFNADGRTRAYRHYP